MLVRLVGERFSLRQRRFELVTKPSYIACKIPLAILAKLFRENSPAAGDLASCFRKLGLAGLGLSIRVLSDRQ